MTSNTELVLRKGITVACDVQHAFDVFTSQTQTWWPKGTHSVAHDDCVDVRIEPRVGGRVFETARDGAEHVWGTVTRWDPPHAVSFTWHPGRDASTAGDVDVRFAAAEVGTSVTLEHRGFERLGDDAQAVWRNYDGGWDFVFGECFGGAAKA